MSDDELRLVVVELIKHLNDWALEIFNEGDYSEKWSQLKKWAEKTENEYEEPND